jgi:hypothetical protein
MTRGLRAAVVRGSRGSRDQESQAREDAPLPQRWPGDAVRPRCLYRMAKPASSLRPDTRAREVVPSVPRFRRHEPLSDRNGPNTLWVAVGMRAVWVRTARPRRKRSPGFRMTRVSLIASGKQLRPEFQQRLPQPVHRRARADANAQHPFQPRFLGDMNVDTPAGKTGHDARPRHELDSRR